MYPKSNDFYRGTLAELETTLGSQAIRYRQICGINFRLFDIKKVLWESIWSDLPKRCFELLYQTFFCSGSPCSAAPVTLLYYIVVCRNKGISVNRIEPHFFECYKSSSGIQQQVCKNTRRIFGQYNVPIIHTQNVHYTCRYSDTMHIFHVFWE